MGFSLSPRKTQIENHVLPELPFRISCRIHLV